MSKAIICDRCGKKSDKNNSINILNNLVVKKYISINKIEIEANLVKDLCNDCLEDLKNFIDNKQNETNHDGCKGCFYEFFSAHEYPCKECKGSYTDKYLKEE